MADRQRRLEIALADHLGIARARRELDDRRELVTAMMDDERQRRFAYLQETRRDLDAARKAASRRAEIEARAEIEPQGGNASLRSEPAWYKRRDLDPPPQRERGLDTGAKTLTVIAAAPSAEAMDMHLANMLEGIIADRLDAIHERVTSLDHEVAQALSALDRAFDRIDDDGAALQRETEVLRAEQAECRAKHRSLDAMLDAVRNELRALRASADAKIVEGEPLHPRRVN
jgi:hypothetical protein